MFPQHQLAQQLADDYIQEALRQAQQDHLARQASRTETSRPDSPLWRALAVAVIALLSVAIVRLW